LGDKCGTEGIASHTIRRPGALPPDGVDALTFGFPLPVHRTPLVSLKAVYVFHGLDRKSERDFAGAIEKLK
jgi:hypothetical protein